MLLSVLIFICCRAAAAERQQQQQQQHAARQATGRLNAKVTQRRQRQQQRRWQRKPKAQLRAESDQASRTNEPNKPHEPSKPNAASRDTARSRATLIRGCACADTMRERESQLSRTLRKKLCLPAEASFGIVCKQSLCVKIKSYTALAFHSNSAAQLLERSVAGKLSV